MALSDIQPLATGLAPSLSSMVSVLRPITSYHPLQVCIAYQSGVCYVVPASPLDGPELITHCQRFPTDFPFKSDLVAAAGFVKEDGKLNFIAFYETLLAAKCLGDFDSGNDKDEDEEYEQLSADQQAVYDWLGANYGSKWDHTDTIEFMGELRGLGIETINHWENAFHSMVDDSYKWEAEFAEEYICELEYNLADSPIFHAINWQRVWDHSLTYDFSTIEFDGSVFIFHSNW